MPLSKQAPGTLHKSLVRTIVENIEERIISGEFKPGERLTEQAMCELLNVSRSPLREAFRVLENRRFLVNKARKGVFVPKLTRKEAIDIYTVRANLESLATSLAVKAKRGGPKGENLVENLRAIHEKMGKAVAKKDLKSYMVYNSRFHDALISACGNDLLIEMLQSFDKQTKRYRISILSNVGKAEESVKKHEALIRSIEDGDAAAAEKIRKEAILDNIALVEEIFKDEEEDIR